MNRKIIGIIIAPFVTTIFLTNCNKGLGDPKPLEECSWETIKQVSELGKAGEWFKIGDEKIVDVNGQPHRVRIIDFNHDDLSDGSGKAGITFEFANLISDKNGYSLATPWSVVTGLFSTVLDFPNYSNLRKAIDGGGRAKEIIWFEKESTTISGTYTTSVLDMLPNNLKSVLKEVKKPIAVFKRKLDDFVVEEYTTQLFPLSYREMTAEPYELAKEEGTTYSFYKDEGDTNINRIKWQVKHHDGALLTSTDVNVPSVEGGVGAFCYAGVNSKEAEEGGSVLLRSPQMIKPTGYSYLYPFDVLDDGTFSYMNSASQFLMGVAPAFCI